MNLNHLLTTLPFPYRIQSTKPFRLEAESRGTFFDQPDYRHLNDTFWESIEIEGWHTCRAGFAILAKKLPGGGHRMLVVHGLKVKPFWTQRGRTGGLSIVADAARVEGYVAQVIRELNRLTKEVDLEIDGRTRSLATENVHEIRSMNTSLYHAGYELQEQLKYDKYQLALAKNVVALSELVSVRIELADLSASSFEERPSNTAAPVPVYKKFDKIVKCYTVYAAKREITLTISGDSRSQTRGTDHFEMIPLVVVDNAVKYSPNKNLIAVGFSEEGSHIHIEIRSLGPKIEEHERERIFERETRGENAIKAGHNGSGIGLYFARRLLNVIGGTIRVEQSTQAQSLQGRQYFLTTFFLTFQKLPQK